MSYQGGCLCGAIRFEADELRTAIGHCHCSMCRRFHGAAFATFASVPKAKFHWLCGADLLKEYEAPNGTRRGFCSQCGSSLTFWSPRLSADVMELALGTFDDPIDARPNAHIFVASKASWYSITDSLPQFDEMPSREPRT